MKILHKVHTECGYEYDVKESTNDLGNVEIWLCAADTPEWLAPRGQPIVGVEFIGDDYKIITQVVLNSPVEACLFHELFVLLSYVHKDRLLALETPLPPQPITMQVYAAETA